jgi:hypothetical protein
MCYSRVAHPVLRRNPRVAPRLDPRRPLARWGLQGRSSQFPSAAIPWLFLGTQAVLPAAPPQEGIPMPSPAHRPARPQSQSGRSKRDVTPAEGRASARPAPLPPEEVGPFSSSWPISAGFSQKLGHVMRFSPKMDHGVWGRDRGRRRGNSRPCGCTIHRGVPARRRRPAARGAAAVLERAVRPWSTRARCSGHNGQGPMLGKGTNATGRPPAEGVARWPPPNAR